MLHTHTLIYIYTYIIIDPSSYSPPPPPVEHSHQSLAYDYDASSDSLDPTHDPDLERAIRESMQTFPSDTGGRNGGKPFAETVRYPGKNRSVNLATPRGLTSMTSWSGTSRTAGSKSLNPDRITAIGVRREKVVDSNNGTRSRPRSDELSSTVSRISLSGGLNLQNGVVSNTTSTKQKLPLQSTLGKIGMGLLASDAGAINLYCIHAYIYVCIYPKEN